jgi:hypothetical protein
MLLLSGRLEAPHFIARFLVGLLDRAAVVAGDLPRKAALIFADGTAQPFQAETRRTDRSTESAEHFRQAAGTRQPHHFISEAEARRIEKTLSGRPRGADMRLLGEWIVIDRLQFDADRAGVEGIVLDGDEVGHHLT